MTAARARPLLALSLLLLAGACLLFAGCGRRSKGDDASAKTASANTLDALAGAGEGLTELTPAPSAAAGATPDVRDRPQCPVAKPHASGNQDGTLESGGLQRSYILHVPPSYDGTGRTPLVLNLHGFGSNARQQAIYSGLPAKADREGFIVVTPDGAGTPQRWNILTAAGVDDVAFMGDLLNRVEADLCIDERQVFAAGISNGSAFAQRLACAMPDRITAVAAVAALVFPIRCGTDRAIPVIAFHGTEDPCVPFTGGTSKCGMGLPVPAVEAAATDWARHDGCDMEPARQEWSKHVRTIAYSECRDDTAVLLFVIDGGGHTWPGSIDVPRLGATTQEVNATDEMWAFFAAQGSLR